VPLWTLTLPTKSFATGAVWSKTTVLLGEEAVMLTLPVPVIRPAKMV
jgi:hypothetical protein